MNKTKKIISILLAAAMFACTLILLCCCDPYIDVHINGLYAVLDTSRNTASIYGFDKDSSVGAYEPQECVVPSIIYYNDKEYTVTELTDNGYERELVVGGHVKKLVIAETVTEINLFGFSMTDTFDYLEEIEVDKNNENYASLDGVLYSKDYLTLIMYPPAKRDTTMYINRGVSEIYESYWNYCNKYVERVSVEEGNVVFSEVDGVLLSNSGTRLEYVPYGHDCVLELPDGVRTIGRLSLRYASIEHMYIPDSVYEVEYANSAYYNPLRYVTNLYFENESPMWIVGMSEYLQEVHNGVSREEFQQLAVKPLQI